MLVLEKFIQTDNSLRAGKQLDMAFLRLKIAFVITVSVSSLLVAALWPVVEHGILLSWLSAQAIVMAMRVALIRRHARTKSDLALRKWKTEYIIGSAIAGLNWGVALFIFHVALLEPTTLLLILVIVGVGAYASVSMAALLHAAVAFLIPTLLPLSVWLFSFNYFLGSVALIYLGLMLLVTYQMHKVILAAHLTTVQNEAQKIALDESGQRMANYFENAPGFFFTLLRNADGHISMPFASTGITALFGLQPAQVAENVSALVTLYKPEDRETIFGEMQRSGQTLTPCRLVFRADHPEKGEIWVEARSVPKQDGEGRIRWNGFMQDITEQKQAEALLQKREREFRALAENAPDPIYRYDRNCRRIYINKAVEQLTGFPLSGILGKSPTEAMPNPSVDAIKAEQVIRRVLDTGTPGELEVSFVTANGRDITVHNLLVPEFAADGSVESVLCIGRDVTARKYMNDVLAKSERSFRTLAENASDHISRYDRRCRLLYLNPNFEATLGLAGGYLHNKSLAEVFSDGLFDDFEEAMKKVIASGQAANHYLVLPDTGDGEHFHHVRMTPEKNDSGNVSGVLAIGRDITELKRYEQSLHVREREFRTLAANLPVAVIRYDKEYRRSYINPAAQRMLRGNEAELLGQQPGGSTVPATPAMIEYYREHMKEVLAGNALRQMEFSMDALPAEQREYFEARFAPEYGADGQLCGVLAIWHDITERKHLEDRLRRREQEFRALSENSPDTIMRYDLGCRRIYVNPAFIELIGLPAENLLGGTPTQYSSTPQAQAYENALRRVLQSGEPGEHEYTWLARGGREIISHFRLIPERDANGMIMSVLAVGRDITAYKKAEAALQKNFRRLSVLHQHLEESARNMEEQTVELEASKEQLKLTEEWYRGILHSAPDGMLVIDRHGIIIKVNAQVNAMFGYEAGELAGNSIEILLPPDARERHIGKRLAFSASGNPGRPMNGALNNLRGYRKDGSEFPVDVSLSLLPDTDGRAGTICAAIRDVTERRRMEDALRTREQEFRTLVENAPDTIARYDRDCRRVYVNPMFAAMVGGGEAALLGTTPSECPGGPNANLYEAKIKEAFANGESTEFELHWPDMDGREICSHVRLTVERDAAGNAVSVLGVGRDITELNSHRKRIYQMAFYDTLTSLPNRALFNDRMHQMLTDAQWHKQQAGVMLLDLDRFKAVNDTLGHAAGDELLRNAAGRLAYCVRGYDTVSRLSGDEFAILLPEVRSGDDLGRVARKILESFNEPFVLEGKEVFVGCSIGIAVYPADGENAEDLLKQADSAMYFAKRSGRNTFRFYSSDLMDSANERLTLETDLRHGFVRGELELYYQPKIRLSDGAVVGSEALLRWHHPERGMIPPDTYIPIAEDCGLIVEIGEWVLHNGCRTARQWNGAGKPLHKVAINLSARQFMSGNLVQTVQQVLAETGCLPEWIELEITESLLLDEDGAVLKMLGTFREMGISIAIDDFGTGYSALSYLARFPIDTLKIDRSFTRRIGEQGHHAELVKAIISIAYSLNQTVVAEGVETGEEAAFLQAHGCHIVQGFLYSRAVPKQQFELLPVSFGRVEAAGA